MAPRCARRRPQSRQRAARLVRRQRARPALAADPRPVRDPGRRGDAAADAGRPRHPQVARLARALSDARRSGRAPRAPMRSAPGRASATTCAPCGCTRIARQVRRRVRRRAAAQRRRPAEPEGRRPLHRRRRGLLRLRAARGDGRHQRAARAEPRVRRRAARRRGAWPTAWCRRGPRTPGTRR